MTLSKCDLTMQRIHDDVIEGLTRRLGPFKAAVHVVYDMTSIGWTVYVRIGGVTAKQEMHGPISLNKDLDELAGKIVEVI